MTVRRTEYPGGFKPFSGVGRTLQADNTSTSSTSQPLTTRCWSCLTGTWDAFVGLLVRIRNCFCCCFGRSTQETPRPTPPIKTPRTEPNTTQPKPVPTPTPNSQPNPPVQTPVTVPTTQPKPVLTPPKAAPVTAPPVVEDVEEEEISVSPAVDKFFAKVEEMDDDVQVAILTQQGLRLFSCLSINEKYWMLKKLVVEYKIPLTDYFPAFFSEINDRIIEDNVCVQPPLAQEEIRKYIIKTFIDIRGQTVDNARLISEWLNGRDKNVDASQVVEAAFEDFNLQVLMTSKTTISIEGAFVLKIVKGALTTGKSPDDVLNTDGGLAHFKQLNILKRITIIESLIAIAGSDRRQILNPTWISRLIKELPEENIRDIAQRMSNEKREIYLK